MLDKRSAAVAMVAIIAAALPVAQALTYGQLLNLYGGAYGQYFGYYGQYAGSNNSITVPATTNNTLIRDLQRRLSGSMPGFGLAPVATALLVILALAQLFV